jgi:hypothetical protein
LYTAVVYSFLYGKHGTVGKYDTHVKPKLLLVAAWARDGLTDVDIAKNLDIGVSTLHAYKKEHPELLESLKRGKEEADVAVENALYKRALGYEYEEITQEPKLDPDGNTKTVGWTLFDGRSSYISRILMVDVG